MCRRSLHVVSMKPEYSKTNDLVLHVVVATDSRDRAVELVRNMEKSSHFRQPQVVAENVVANTSEQTASSGAIQFDIAAIYVPSAADVDDKPDAGAAPAEKTAPPPMPARSGEESSHGARWERCAARKARCHRLRWRHI